MRRSCALRFSLALALMLCGSGLRSLASGGGDPLQLFAPWIVVSDADRRTLDADGVVVYRLPADDGQIGVFAVTRLNAPPESLVAWTRSIEELKRGRFVLGTGRFQDPPQLADLDNLYLDESELDSLRGCALNDCVLRLTAGEIESLRTVVTASGSMWRDAAEREFRRLLLERLRLYRQGGLAALPPTAHRSTPVSFAESFAAVLEKSPYLARVPLALDWLRDGGTNHADLESFLYWSNEDFGAGKPVISVTHVAILRRGEAGPGPEVLVIAKQIFSTHYVNAAVGLTAVVVDPRTGARHLLYLNRSDINPLRGFLGGFRRSIAEGRIERDTPKLVRALRTRLESGNPP